MNLTEPINQEYLPWATQSDLVAMVFPGIYGFQSWRGCVLASL